jgi:tripartite-type tricarboxylate transporter receptor subunit TctC
MRRMIVTAALALCLPSGALYAQTAYPNKPVRVIVPFAPGGVTDTAARLVGQQLSAKWKHQVVIENKPGAGGVIGVETAARSAPDG